MSRRRTRSADPLPFVLIALFAVITYAVYARRGGDEGAHFALPTQAQELQAFRQRYGPVQYSQFGEEHFIRDFFQDRRGGVFVDVGAGHFANGSNTYYLEKNLGWSGLAIDPLKEFAADYEKHRPNTRFIPMFVSDRSDATAKLYVGTNSVFSSADRGFVDKWTGVVRTMETPTITLDDLLAGSGIERFDFLSMDIELHEPQALAGFDIERHRPALVCIEAHPEVRQRILNYFAKHGYVLVSKYMSADRLNLWFAPLDDIR